MPAGLPWSRPTFEQSFIQAFGPRLHEVVTDEFEERGIDGHTAEMVTEVLPGKARSAPGDAGDFPVKQAFLAFLQADTVAEHIGADVTGHSFESPLDPASMCVMEMFDKATFAQVPLELTGDPQPPVRVRPGADGAYKVGTSPLWRLGKKMLGFSVPMRFRAGEPLPRRRALPRGHGLADDGRRPQGHGRGTGGLTGARQR